MNARFERKPRAFKQATDTANLEARAKVQDIKERLEKGGLTKVQADFGVMPVQRHGFTTVREVRMYLERTRPTLFSSVPK